MATNKLNFDQYQICALVGECAASGDITAFKTLVNDGADVNGIYYRGESVRRRKTSLINEAILLRNTELLEYLLHNNADVNRRVDEYGSWSALWVAHYNRRPKIVEMLVKYGSGVDQHSQLQSDQSDLEMAISSCTTHMDMIKVLNAGGSNVNLSQATNILPITYAAITSSVDIVKVLLENGAIVEDVDGNHPENNLLEALFLVKLEIAQLFLTHGADVNFKAQGNHCAIETLIRNDQCRRLEEEKVQVVSLLVKCGTFCNIGHLKSLSECIKNWYLRKKLLKNCLEFDTSLRNMCRSKIRSHLRQCCHNKSIYSSVDTLPLPRLMKDYILYTGDFKVFTEL